MSRGSTITTVSSSLNTIVSSSISVARQSDCVNDDGSHIGENAPRLSGRSTTAMARRTLSGGSHTRSSQGVVEIVEPLIKRVKRGYRGPSVLRSCGIVFEDVPLWLWSIRVSEFTHILISVSGDKRLRQDFLSTWQHVHFKLRVVEEDTLMDSQVDVWFLSGSHSFLGALSLMMPLAPTASWVYPAGRRLNPTNRSLGRWITIAHSQVGGATTMTGTFCVSHVDPVVVEPDPIVRSIDHVLKYGERPTPCSVDWSVPHYRVTDRLSVHHLDRPVLYQSDFSRTGWGQRQLLPLELGHAFDLPPFISWQNCFRSRIVPVQLLRVVADQVLCALQSGDPPCRTLSPVLGVSLSCRPTHDKVFLPALQKWLPGEWADVIIADRAVKADDARVDFSPWHRRISLVLPACSSLAILWFEAFGLRWWRRTLFRSFVTYLTHEYGSNWQRRAWNHHRSTHHRRVLPLRGSLSKRRRLEEGTMYQIGGGISLECSTLGEDEVDLMAAEPAAEVVELCKDVECGRAVLAQVLASTWWDWSNGSALIFWRWNGIEQRRAARDGIEIFVQSPLPSRRKIKQTRLDPLQRVLVSQKIEGMMRRAYLEPGFVTNALHFFAVPKGDSDVRVVFDGTSSGLNETLWAPNFYLPTARAAALNITFSSWMSDMDCGEMFHNFPMDKRIRKCSGLQVDKFAPMPIEGVSANKQPSFIRWSRLFMGMRPSPYLAVRHYYWAEEFAKGNPALKSNPMGFDRIVLNLPGMLDYNPTLPKVMKWNSEAGAIAGDVITFVDDIRISGFSKENCHDVHRQFASRIQFLGMQDAPRKFRPPSQEQAGAWTGTIFRITSDTISKSVSQEKWDKGVGIIKRLRSMVQCEVDGRPMLDRKSLERDTGFLNHLSMTFENLVPYLKGFYLTLNSWRSGRDSDDWKLSNKHWNQILHERFHNGDISEMELELELGPTDQGEAPDEVKASPRFEQDMEALFAIFSSTSNPPKVSLRSRQILTVIYGFGDASGSGLGATFSCGNGFTFRIGVWGEPDKVESSNWKEFTNVVEALEEEGAEGNLNNAEIFMFTDNSTVEACAEKGSSSSKKLLDLIIRLQSLTTKLGVRIHIFHVAGTRMIAQGTDGVSRGYLGQGVMAGESMKVHIPIYLSAVERSPHRLMSWIRDWTSSEAILLDPLGWFQTGHDISGWRDCADGFPRPIIQEGRTYVWAPPPFAADVAIAELRKARIKRQTSGHVFVCPRLCTALWQKQLFKCADLVFEVPVGSQLWPIDMHEPLLIGILFPFLRVKPWQLRGTPKMYQVGRDLRGLLQNNEMDPRDFLREFWRTASLELHRMSERLVWKLLYFK